MDNEQLLAIVRKVAAMKATTGNGHCDACGGDRLPATVDPKRHRLRIGDDYEHTADCPIAEARAYLAAQGEGQA